MILDDRRKIDLPWTKKEDYLGSQEEFWSERALLLAKLETTLRTALVRGQTLVTFESDCYCCTAGEPAEEVVVAAANIVVVVDSEESLMMKLLLEQDW